VREAIFSALGEMLHGARVWDLFAGSGALGLEAWSRGAESVVWVEKERYTYKVLQRNITTLCDSDDDGMRKCICGDALLFVKRQIFSPVDIVFADPPYEKDGGTDGLLNLLTALFVKRQIFSPVDIIFADPPYEKDGGTDGLLNLLTAIASHSCLTDHGILAIREYCSIPKLRRSVFRNGVHSVSECHYCRDCDSQLLRYGDKVFMMLR